MKKVIWPDKIGKYYFYTLYHEYFIEFDSIEDVKEWFEQNMKLDEYFDYDGCCLYKNNGEENWKWEVISKDKWYYRPEPKNINPLSEPNIPITIPIKLEDIKGNIKIGYNKSLKSGDTK